MRRWAVGLGLALLLHVGFLASNTAWLAHPPTALRPRVDVQQVDPRKLEAIRNKWREREKQLLLSKDKSHVSDEAPKDARYMSDKNRMVEREQRARQTDVLPRPGGQARPAQPREQAQPKQEPQKQAQTRPRVPALGNLGVPLPKPARTPIVKNTPRENNRAGSVAEQSDAQAPGADQSLVDRKLPEGSENLLNTAESVYYSFYARIYETIAPVWVGLARGAVGSRAIQPGQYVTRLNVAIDEEGNLIGTTIEQSSGIAELDLAAANAWRRIGRFPNPPHDLLRRGQAVMGWSFVMDVGTGGFQFLPPERND